MKKILILAVLFILLGVVIYFGYNSGATQAMMDFKSQAKNVKTIISL